MQENEFLHLQFETNLFTQCTLHENSTGQPSTIIGHRSVELLTPTIHIPPWSERK